MRPQQIAALLDKAYGYTEVHGDGFYRALVAHAAGRLGQSEALAALGAFQAANGGFWGIGTLKAPLATMSNTINGLMWLCFLGGADSALTERAVGFLRRTQRPDGGWDEVERIRQHNPTIWMVPGNYSNQVWYTVAICRYLMELGREGGVDFGAALDFVRRGWDGTGFPDYIHPHWMGLYVFSRLPQPDEADREIAAGCLGRLAEYAGQPQLNAGELGETAYAALGAGEAAAELFDKAQGRLAAGQAAEGYWDFADGDLEDRVVSTAKVCGFWRGVLMGGSAGA